MTPEDQAEKIAIQWRRPSTRNRIRKLVTAAIRDAQAEQRRKDAEIAKVMIGARPREIADAILSQEDE